MTVWFMKVYTLDNKMRGKFMDKENLNSNKYFSILDYLLKADKIVEEENEKLKQKILCDKENITSPQK